MPQIRPIGISGSIPATNQLALGDIALNVYDGKAYIKKLVGNVESIVELGTGGSSISASYALSSSYALNGGVTQLIAGTNVTLSPAGGTGAVTVNAIVSSSGSGTPNGPLYSLQFNNGGLFSGSGNLTFLSNSNLQLTGSLIISGSIIGPNFIDFNTASVATQPTVGKLSWNNTDGTLDLGLKGGNVTLQIGQETVARVVNKTDGNLLESEFRVVRVRSVAEGGAQGQRLAVVLAQADSDADSATTLGVVTEDIANNQEGFVTVFGLVRGINTTGANSWLGLETWVDGDMLYLSPFYPGYLTNVKPTAPNHLVIVGYVEYAHANNGKLFVKIDNGWELGELHDVLDTTTSSSYGDLLIKSGSVWINSKALTGSYSITGSLTISGSSTFINIGPAVFSGSVTGIAGFTGSLLGTASWASNALTSSYTANALTASYINPLFQSVLISGSTEITGSTIIKGNLTVNSATTVDLNTSVLNINAPTITVPTFATPYSPSANIRTVMYDTVSNALFVTSSLPGTGGGGGFANYIATGSITASVNVNPNSLFLINSGSVEIVKVNAERVVVLEARTDIPTPVTGGIYFSASGDFFFGM